MPKKISNRLIIPHLTLITFLIFVLLFFIVSHVRQKHLDLIKKKMYGQLELIVFILKDKKASEFSNQHSPLLKEIASLINLRITFIDLSGQVLADTRIDEIKNLDNHRYRPEVKQALQEKTGENIRYSDTLKTDMLYVCKRFKNIFIRLAKPLKEIEETSSKLTNFILTAGLLVILISSLIIIIITNRITRPLKETLIFAQDFTKGLFSKRILNYSDDEIGILQKSLNRLADSIEEKINYLVLEQNKLKVTIESISDGIAVIDSNKKILIYNKSFASLLGIDFPLEGEIYFEAIRDLFLNTAIEKNLNSGKIAFFEEQKINNIFFEILISPIKDKKTIQGIIVVLHNITERKKVAIIKKDLVSNMSHELKTPLTILKGYLETMESCLDDPKMAKNFLGKALQNIDRQNSLINDILKLSRLESTDHFSDEPIKLKEIIENCLTILNPKILAKDLRVDLSLENNFAVEGNKFLAEEIVFNLIDNAINYNISGGIIKIKIEKKERDGSGFSILISNTGSIIPAEATERIFERFYRVDNGRSRETGGTGLGLSIVKHAADLLGWQVDLITTDQENIFKIEIS